MSSYNTSQSQTGDLTTIPEERSQDFTFSTKTGVSRAALRPARYGTLSDGVRSLRLDTEKQGFPESYTGPAVPDSGGTGIMRLPRYYPKYQPDTYSSPPEDEDPVDGRRRSLYAQSMQRHRRSSSAGNGAVGGGYMLRPIDERFEGRSGEEAPPELGSGRKFLVDEMDPDRLRLDIFDDGSTPVSTFHPSQRFEMAATKAAIYRSQKKELRARLKKEKQVARSGQMNESYRHCSLKCVTITFLVLFLVIGAALAIALGLYFGLRDGNKTPSPETEYPQNQTAEVHAVPMEGSLVFRGYEFTSDYENVSSPQAVAMTQNICAAFYQVLIAVSSSRSTSKLESCSVTGFRNGSLWSDFSLVLSDYRTPDDDPQYQDLRILVQDLIQDDVTDVPDSSVFHKKFPESEIILEQLIVVVMPTTAYSSDVTSDMSTETTVTMTTTDVSGETTSEWDTGVTSSGTSSTENITGETIETVAMGTQTTSKDYSNFTTVLNSGSNNFSKVSLEDPVMTSSTSDVIVSKSSARSAIQTTKLTTTRPTNNRNISESIPTVSISNYSSSISINSSYSRETSSILNISTSISMPTGHAEMMSSTIGDSGSSNSGSSNSGSNSGSSNSGSSSSSSSGGGSSNSYSVTPRSVSSISGKSSDSGTNITRTTFSSSNSSSSTAELANRTVPMTSHPAVGNFTTAKSFITGKEENTTIVASASMSSEPSIVEKTPTPPFPGISGNSTEVSSSDGSNVTDRTTTPGFEAIFSFAKSSEAESSAIDARSTEGFFPSHSNGTTVSLHSATTTATEIPLPASPTSVSTVNRHDVTDSDEGL